MWFWYILFSFCCTLCFSRFSSKEWWSAHCKATRTEESLFPVWSDLIWSDLIWAAETQHITQAIGTYTGGIVYPPHWHPYSSTPYNHDVITAACRRPRPVSPWNRMLITYCYNNKYMSHLAQNVYDCQQASMVSLSVPRLACWVRRGWWHIYSAYYNNIRRTQLVQLVSTDAKQEKKNKKQPATYIIRPLHNHYHHHHHHHHTITITIRPELFRKVMAWNTTAPSPAEAGW